MDVTDVLRDRMQAPPGLQRMVAISVLVHAGLVAVVIVGPGEWIVRRHDPPRPVMTISLGSGAPGVQSGGLTAMGGRAVQAETPDVKRQAIVTQPAAKAPAMTMPLPAKTPAKATPPVKQAPDTARGRVPSTGADAQVGSTTVETNVRGQGFGLSTSGGVGTGIVHLDVTDFCCLSYLDAMSQRIRANWNPKAETPSEVIIKFTIRRDGTIVNTIPEKSSGNALLDIRAQQALVTTRQLPALPAEYPNPELVVHLTFQYIR